MLFIIVFIFVFNGWFDGVFLVYSICLTLRLRSAFEPYLDPHLLALQVHMARTGQSTSKMDGRSSTGFGSG